MNAFWRIAVVLAALVGAQPGARCRGHPFVRFGRRGGEKTANSPSPRPCACAPRAARYGTASIATFRSHAGGTLREVTFSLIGVSRDGNPEPYRTERTHGFIRIYAGEKGRADSVREHTYVFQHRTGRQVRWFDGKPKLDWNVTGNFWNFPTEAASYHLHLADGASPVRWTAYTGRLGAIGRVRSCSRHALGRDHVAAFPRRKFDRGRRFAGRRGRAGRSAPRCPRPSHRPRRGW